MLIKKLHTNRRKIAISILAVFSVVFVCDFLCDLGIANNTLAHADGHHTHEEVATNHHHGDHSHNHEFDSTPHEQSHHDKDGEDEDCCEEETSKIYASLVKYELPKFDLDKVVVLLDLPWSTAFNLSHSYIETNPYRLNSALSPPVTGLYACILFQSFLC